MKEKISEVMSKDVQVIAPETSAQQAARYMKDLNIGLLPVCDGDTLLGVVTDRDLALRVVAQGAGSTTKVEQVMSVPPIYCLADQDLEDATRIMESQQIRRLLVLDSQHRLVGIVSLGDLAIKSGRRDLAEEVLEKVSTPLKKEAAA